MSNELKRFKFMSGQKPICTQSPIKSALGPDRHRELRAKYKLELGLDLLEDRCNNVFNCKSAGSGCVGRPFPIDAEIKKALDSINVTVSTQIHKGIKVYMAQAIVDCSTCPFKVGCEVSCPTQESFLNRNTRPESNPPESSLVPYDDFERGMYTALDASAYEHCSYGDWVNEDLPLDCLTSRQREVFEMSLYQGLEHKEIAYNLGIQRPTVTIHLERAHSKLEEFGKARKAIREGGVEDSRVIDYYVNNLSQEEIAVKEGVNQYTVSRHLTDWYNSVVCK